MPWKDGYTISDEVSIDQVEWPDGHQCAVTIVVDCSVLAGPAGITDDDIAAHEAQFGINVGIPRLFELLESYRCNATFALPAVVAEAFPSLAGEIVQRGHEVAAHGYLHEDVSGLPLEEERRRLELATRTLTDLGGHRPAGWYALPRQSDRYPGGQISPNTVNLIIDAGYEYLGNSMADDVPHYWVSDFRSRKSILAMPYYYHFNDLYFLMFPAPGGGTGLENPKALYNNWTFEFDAIYPLGRQFSMVVHPYLIGWGHRVEVLENTLRHIREFPRVWNPTVVECAQYWKRKYPASTFLKLEESIWKDYPGSLS